MVVAIIISGVVILLTSVGFSMYYGIAKENPWAIPFVGGCVIGMILIDSRCSEIQKSPEEIEKKYQTLLENVEESKKELEHFYIEHPEFRLQNEDG